MREIKFRLYYHDCELKRIVYGTHKFEVTDKRLHIMLASFECNTIKGFCQFTGKKDCKGTEIYEGDIIEFDKTEWGGNDNIHVVTWDEENAEWSWGGGATGDMEWRTVIGNVYQNPKLLKK